MRGSKVAVGKSFKRHHGSGSTMSHIHVLSTTRLFAALPRVPPTGNYCAVICGRPCVCKQAIWLLSASCANTRLYLPAGPVGQNQMMETTKVHTNAVCDERISTGVAKWHQIHAD